MTDPKTLVVYYSLNGNTRAAAETVAGYLDAEIDQITARIGKGPFGFLKAGYTSSRAKHVPIDAPDRDLSGFDLIVFASPLWAGRISSPMRSYLDRHKGRFPHHAAFLISEAGSPPDRAFADFRSLTGRKPVAEAAITDADRKANTDQNMLEEFAAKCRCAAQQPATAA